jgi:hypothetical protein
MFSQTAGEALGGDLRPDPSPFPYSQDQPAEAEGCPDALANFAQVSILFSVDNGLWGATEQ